MKTRFGMRALPLLLVMLLVGAAVPAVSAYSADDDATLDWAPLDLTYDATTTVTPDYSGQTMDKIYIQANLWRGSTCVASSNMEESAGTNFAYAGSSEHNPGSGTYQCKGYRCIVEGGIQDKNWFVSSTTTL